MVCFFRKVFFKSDPAVALRISISKVPCIIVVSFINVYYEYFCVLMWLSAKLLHVLELLNITLQSTMRFLDINMYFIEQNIHVLCNMKSYECHLMKIIIDNFIYNSAFCESSLWLEKWLCFSVTWW